MWRTKGVLQSLCILVVTLLGGCADESSGPGEVKNAGLRFREPLEDDIYHGLYDVMEPGGVSYTAYSESEGLILRKRLVDKGKRLEAVDLYSDRVVDSVFSDNPLMLTWSKSNKSVFFVDSNKGDGVYKPYHWTVGSGRAEQLDLPWTASAGKLPSWTADGRYLAYFVKARENWEWKNHIAVYDFIDNTGFQVELQTGNVRDFELEHNEGELLLYLTEPGVVGIKVIGVFDGEERRTHVPQYHVRDIAINTEEKLLVFNMETSESDYYKLAWLHLHSGETASIEVLKKRDALDPVFLDGNLFAYKIEGHGRQGLAVVDSSESWNSKILWHDLGRCEFLGTTGVNVLAKTRGVFDRGGIYEIALSGEERRMIKQIPVPKGMVGTVSPAMLEIPTPEGTVIHGIYWGAQPRTGSGLVVYVHGGPHVKIHPAFSIYRQYFLENGHSVLGINYRGSTGYGAKYSSFTNPMIHVADVISAIKYAKVKYGFDREKVVVRGDSYGTLLVAMAMALEPELVRGIVLVSPLPLPYVGKEQSLPRDVVMFIGENDHRDLDGIVGTMRQILGGGESLDIIAYSMANEGHNFKGRRAWSHVGAAELRMLEGRWLRGN